MILPPLQDGKQPRRPVIEVIEVVFASPSANELETGQSGEWVPRFVRAGVMQVPLRDGCARCEQREHVVHILALID